MSEGGHGDAGRLERRARWLLRAYPAAYRADRGEEIIGTLLEAVPPGRDWPPVGYGRARRDHPRDHGFARGRLRPRLAAAPAHPRFPANDQRMSVSSSVTLAPGLPIP
jgi:hypothetical protein